MKGSAEEMILIEGVRTWFVQKKNYDDNMHKAYAMLLVKCREVSEICISKKR